MISAAADEPNPWRCGWPIFTFDGTTTAHSDWIWDLALTLEACVAEVHSGSQTTSATTSPACVPECVPDPLPIAPESAAFATNASTGSSDWRRAWPEIVVRQRIDRCFRDPVGEDVGSLRDRDGKREEHVVDLPPVGEAYQ